MGAYIDQISGDLNEKDMKEREVKTKNISKDDIQSVSDRGKMAMCAFNKYSWKSSQRQLHLILTGSLRKLSQS